MNPRLDMLTLVPNRVALRARVADRLRASPGVDCIPVPDIRTLSEWGRDLVTRAHLVAGREFPAIAGHWTLVNAWEDAIEAEGGPVQPTERAALAERAVEADRLLRQWVEGEPGGLASPAWRQFLAWRRRMEEWLRERCLATPSETPRALEAALQAGDVPRAWLPKAVRLEGFAEFTRAERGLFAALRGAGVEVSDERAVAPVDAECRVRSFRSPEAEMAAVADWAAQAIESGKERLAIIVIGPDTLSERLGRVLANRLHPGRCLSFADHEDANFHLARGRDLAEVPLIRDALLLLRLSLDGIRRPQDFERISSLLLSPCWAGSLAERAARADLELELRRLGGYRWSLARLAERASRSAERRPLPMLLERINRLPDPTRPGGPAERFRHWLEHWGWAGNTGSGACATHMQHALEALSRLDVSSPERALALLGRMLSVERLADVGGPFSPVQVLSPEDAVGLRFDAAWVLNASAEDWPGPARLNPFIPAPLTRHIPRATDDGMFAYARGITDALRVCAPGVIFSYARFSGDTPRTASWLLRGVREEESELSADGALWRQCAPWAAEHTGATPHPWLEAVTDRYGLACGEGILAVPRFVQALELQSACPLAAYFAHRLHASLPDPPQPFPPPSVTGMIVHRALEILYRPFLGGEGLPGPAQVTDAVAEALREAHADLQMLPAVLEAERERLAALLEEWVAFERAHWPHRPLRLEWKTREHFAGFEVDVRVDRLDRADDKGVFILDYKTGAIQSASRWADARPGQVQLPLYATLLAAGGDSRPRGVAMVRLRREEMGFVGAGGEAPSPASGIADFNGKRATLDKAFESWDACLSHWQRSLQALADEFRAGSCENRVHDEAALRWTGLEPLLRRREGEEWLQAGGGDAAG